MKRLISSALCMILCFNLLCLSVSAEENYKLSNEQISLLTAIEMYNEDDLLSEKITRAQFADMLVKSTFEEPEYLIEGTESFADVATDYEYYDSIMLLKNLKVTLGDGMGNFNPEEEILTNDAIVMAVRFLGYTKIAEKTGYIPFAAQKGISKDMHYTYDETLSRYNALLLVFNVLNTDVSDRFVDETIASTYMKAYRKIFTIEGAVTDDGIISLSGETKVGEGQIIINNHIFDNKTHKTDLLGYNVRAYYRYDNEDKIPDLLSVYVKETTSDTVILDSMQLIDYDNNIYKYYTDIENEVEDEINISRDYTLIFNGKVYKAETAEEGFNLSVNRMMMPKNGSVKLIDTDDDREYDLVMVKYYNDYIVESYDVENLTIYGKTEITPGKISLSSARNNITYYNALMRETDFDLIHSGYVVSVAKSADGLKAEIIINANNISGVLNSSDDSEYVINGESYKFSDIYKKYINTNMNTTKVLPYPGDNCKLYVNFKNEIIFSSVESRLASQYGILTAVGYTGRGFGKKVALEIFTEENNVVTFELADRVEIDGKIFKKSDDIYEYLKVTNDFTTDGKFSGLIMYSFNGEKKINYIDTPYFEAEGNPNDDRESKNTLHVMENGEKQVVRYRNDKQTFSGKFLGRADTLYISMPDAVDDIREDMVVTTLTDTSNISNANGNLIEVMAFSTETESMYADVVVRYLARSKSNLTDNLQYYVVENIADVRDNDGEYVKRLTLTNGKVKKDYLTETSDSLKCGCNSGPCATHPLEAEVGDIIKVCFNKYDRIADGGVFVAYDYSTGLHWAVCSEDVHSGTQNEPIIQSAKASEYTRYSVLRGYLNKREGEAAEFMIDCWPYVESTSFRNQSIKTEMEYNTKKIFSLEDAYVIEVNPSGGRTVRNITTNELKMYNDGLAEMKKIMILTYNHAPYLIVVYK